MSQILFIKLKGGIKTGLNEGHLFQHFKLKVSALKIEINIEK